jgi:hypothetical protein
MSFKQKDSQFFREVGDLSQTEKRVWSVGKDSLSWTIKVTSLDPSLGLGRFAIY